MKFIQGKSCVVYLRNLKKKPTIYRGKIQDIDDFFILFFDNQDGLTKMFPKSEIVKIEVKE